MDDGRWHYTDIDSTGSEVNELSTSDSSDPESPEFRFNESTLFCNYCFRCFDGFGDNVGTCTCRGSQLMSLQDLSHWVSQLWSQPGSLRDVLFDSMMYPDLKSFLIFLVYDNEMLALLEPLARREIIVPPDRNGKNIDRMNIQRSISVLAAKGLWKKITSLLQGNSQDMDVDALCEAISHVVLVPGRHVDEWEEPNLPENQFTPLWTRRSIAKKLATWSRGSSAGPLPRHSVEELQKAEPDLIYQALNVLATSVNEWPFACMVSKSVGVPNGAKVRPIAVAHPLVRLIANYVQSEITRIAFEGPDPLVDPTIQLCFQTNGPFRTALTLSARARLEKAAVTRGCNSVTWLLSLDASNAFNSIDSRAIVSALTRLEERGLDPHYSRVVWRCQSGGVINPRGEHLARTSGLKQGDASSLVLYLIATQPILDAILSELRAYDPTATMVVYADDVSILYDAECMKEACEAARRSGATEAADGHHFVYSIAERHLRTIGLMLNPLKTRLASLLDLDASSPTWLPEVQRYPLKICGIDVFPGAHYLQQRYEEQRGLIQHAFEAIDSMPLTALRLVRRQYLTKTAYHAAGTEVSLEFLDEQQRHFDDCVRQCLQMTPNELPSRAIALPTKYGGLGMKGPLFSAIPGAVIRIGSLIDVSERQEDVELAAQPELEILHYFGLTIDIDTSAHFLRVHRKGSSAAPLELVSPILSQKGLRRKIREWVDCSEETSTESSGYLAVLLGNSVSPIDARVTHECLRLLVLLHTQPEGNGTRLFLENVAARTSELPKRTLRNIETLTTNLFRTHLLNQLVNSFGAERVRQHVPLREPGCEKVMCTLDIAVCFEANEDNGHKKTVFLIDVIRTAQNPENLMTGRRETVSNLLNRGEHTEFYYPLVSGLTDFSDHRMTDALIDAINRVARVSTSRPIAKLTKESVRRISMDASIIAISCLTQRRRTEPGE